MPPLAPASKSFISAEALLELEPSPTTATPRLAPNGCCPSRAAAGGREELASLPGVGRLPSPPAPPQPGPPPPPPSPPAEEAFGFLFPFFAAVGDAALTLPPPAAIELVLV